MRVVHVERRPDIEAVRSRLPITGMEQEVMEALLHNDVVVLCGETGCGKTTQVCHSCCTVIFCAFAAYAGVNNPTEAKANWAYTQQLHTLALSTEMADATSHSFPLNVMVFMVTRKPEVYQHFAGLSYMLRIDVVVLCGENSCNKATQVAVAMPRRVKCNTAQ